MDVNEILLKERGTIQFPEPVYETSTSPLYRFTDKVKEFSYEWKYIYDGAIFVSGSFGMREITTGMPVASVYEISGQITSKKCIAIFKDKLLRDSRNIHEVIRDCKNRNLDIDLWLINSVII